MTRQRPLLAALCALLLPLSGCGLLGGTQDPAPAGGPLGPPIHVTVATLATSDQVTLHLATKAGLFAAEGLVVDSVPGPSGAANVAKLIAGEVNIAYSSYTPFFVAQQKLGGQTPLKLIADGTADTPGYTMVSAMPNSPVKHIENMGGKRVAISGLNTMSHLATKAVLTVAGVDVRTITWVEMPFPQMAGALQRGVVDAAYLVQPYVEMAASTVGAVPIFDTAPASGPTKDMPLTGYGARQDWVDQNGSTVEKFQRAMIKATDIADTDVPMVWSLIHEYAGVDEGVAKRATRPSFQSSLDPTRIQRVVTLMVDNGALAATIDVSTMIVPPPRPRPGEGW